MSNSAYVDRIKYIPMLKGFDAFANNVRGHIDNLIPRKSVFLSKAAAVQNYEQMFASMSKSELQCELNSFRATAARDKLNGRELLKALASVCEAAHRSMEMRPYKVQIAAALGLHQGCIMEMATGEGKTLTAAIAAVIIGWKGRGCHVMTSNHYLACRDAEEFTPLFNYCGLKVSSINPDSDPNERRKAYRADITYCTNKDTAADFLRDQLNMGTKQTSGRLVLDRINGGSGRSEPILTGLEYAIVDEADSVMIDDGVTPLLISTESPNSAEVKMYRDAGAIAAALKPEHYKIIEETVIELTKKGKKYIGAAAEGLSGVWKLTRRREELITQALKALHLFNKDKDYIVDDGKVVIVDKETGRTMPDRFWRNGMHQAVEAKESLDISAPKDTCARISFQKFFRMYGFLCGMTGTASEAAPEFYSFYNLPVVKIPTHKRCLRKFTGRKVSLNEDAKWKSVAMEVDKQHSRGRPILIGTGSIKDSERLSACLKDLNIEHVILNAKNHSRESAIVKEAGKKGKVTVATSMASRGTDIKLTEETRKNGLLVITTQMFHSKRIDRQLQGRCSRQGDPGSVICFYSMEDELLKKNMTVARHIMKLFIFLPSFVLVLFFKAAQYSSVKKSRKQRKSVMKNDDWLEDILGFTGENY